MNTTHVHSVTLASIMSSVYVLRSLYCTRGSALSGAHIRVTVSVMVRVRARVGLWVIRDRVRVTFTG